MGTPTDSSVELVPLGEIDPNPWQTRLTIDADEVRALAEDIAEHGLLQPPIGRRVNGRVQLAFGHRRLAAFYQIFGVQGNDQVDDPLAQMPVFVRELSDRQMADFALAENGQRSDLSAIEKGKALRRYIAEFGVTQAEAGKTMALSQSAVSQLIRLVEELPEPVQALVDQRALPERFARQLVSVAKIAPEKVVKAAQAIVEAEESEREEMVIQTIESLFNSHAKGLDGSDGCYWPMDWRPEDAPGAVACQNCPMQVVAYGIRYCTDPTHFEGRAVQWLEHELQRLSAKFGIEIAQPGDSAVKVLDVSYSNGDMVKGILKRKNKPESLRLLPRSKSNDSRGYYHAEMLGSKVVVLGSTDPRILDREQAAKEARDHGQKVALLDDEAAQAAAKEAEQAEQDARREGRAAARRAQHDIPWLIFNTAEVCGDQLQVSGAALEWMSNLVFDHSRGFVGWAEYDDRMERLAAEIEAAKVKNLESLLRRQMLAHRLVDEIYEPDARYTWAEALEDIQLVVKQLALKLPVGWDQPPIWKTKANCHVCGKFTSMEHVTQRDQLEGWQIEGDRVTCSDECRAKGGNTKDTKGTKGTKKAKSQAKPKGKKR